ncbi:MAG: hypothetical protein U5K74_07050 [Gemmatimonadaceae bacterium]|nr:hypothetical protein [Gemmatimonadaceae bacterium]
MNTTGITTVKAGLLLGAGVLLAACNGPRRVNERPIMTNGDRTASQDRIIAGAAAEGFTDNAMLTQARDSVYAKAVATCRGTICASVVKGELSLGMTLAQAMAATRTAPAAWTIRESGDATVMVPRVLGNSPRDATGEVVMVQFDDERLNAVSYRETQGIRVVSAAEDTTTDGRATAMADALIREGDQFNAAGDRARALDRYDRALALKRADPMLEMSGHDARPAAAAGRGTDPLQAIPAVTGNRADPSARRCQCPVGGCDRTGAAAPDHPRATVARALSTSRATYSPIVRRLHLPLAR